MWFQGFRYLYNYSIKLWKDKFDCELFMTVFRYYNIIEFQILNLICFPSLKDWCSGFNQSSVWENASPGFHGENGFSVQGLENINYCWDCQRNFQWSLPFKNFRYKTVWHFNPLTDHRALRTRCISLIYCVKSSLIGVSASVLCESKADDFTSGKYIFCTTRDSNIRMWRNLCFAASGKLI